MKKRKWIAAVLAFVLCTALMLACGNEADTGNDRETGGNPTIVDGEGDGQTGGESDGDSAPEHRHTFADTYTYDAEYHWYAATCGDTQEVSGNSAHTFGAWSQGEGTLTCLLDDDNVRVCICGYEDRIAATAHKLSETALVAKDCDTDGVAAYWTCDDCGKMFSDANAAHEITEPAAIPASHGVLCHVDEVPASCTAEGTEELWYCADCGQKFSDEQGTHPIDKAVSVPKTSHAVAVKSGSEYYSGSFVLPNGFSVVQNVSYNDYWQCNDCGKMFADENCEKEITNPAKYHARAFPVLFLGNNLMCITGSTIYLYFKAEETGRYAISLKDATYVRIGYFTKDTNNSGVTVYNAGWSATNACTEHFAANDPVENNKLGNLLYADMQEGEVLYIYLNGITANEVFGVNAIKMEDNVLNEGDNTVNVTVANSAEDIDVYLFIPTESKTYSLTVPEGVSVVMNGRDMIEDGGFANFEAMAGECIEFCFISATVGAYTATIGNEIELPSVLSIDEDVRFKLESAGLNGSTPIYGVKVLSLQDIEDGARYTITITVPRSAGQSQLYFAVNFEATQEYAGQEMMNSDAVLRTNALAMGMQNPENYEVAGNGATVTITLTLHTDDLLYFTTNALGQEFTFGLAKAE